MGDKLDGGAGRRGGQPVAAVCCDGFTFMVGCLGGESNPVSPRCHRGVAPLDLPGIGNHGVGRGSRTHTSWGTTRRPTVGPSSHGHQCKCLKRVRPAGLEPAHSVSETDAATDDWATDAKIAAKGVAPDVQGYEPQLSTRTAAMGESTRPRSRTGSFSLGPSWSSRQPRRVYAKRDRQECARGDSNPQSQVLSLVSLPVRLRARGRGGSGSHPPRAAYETAPSLGPPRGGDTGQRERIRTSGLLLPKQTLYSTELHAEKHLEDKGQGSGTRTRGLRHPEPALC